MRGINLVSERVIGDVEVVDAVSLPQRRIATCNARMASESAAVYTDAVLASVQTRGGSLVYLGQGEIENMMRVRTLRETPYALVLQGRAKVAGLRSRTTTFTEGWSRFDINRIPDDSARQYLNYVGCLMG